MLVAKQNLLILQNQVLLIFDFIIISKLTCLILRIVSQRLKREGLLACYKLTEVTEKITTNQVKTTAMGIKAAAPIKVAKKAVHLPEKVATVVGRIAKHLPESEKP